MNPIFIKVSKTIIMVYMEKRATQISHLDLSDKAKDVTITIAVITVEPAVLRFSRESEARVIAL